MKIKKTINFILLGISLLSLTTCISVVLLSVFVVHVNNNKYPILNKDTLNISDFNKNMDSEVNPYSGLEYVSKKIVPFEKYSALSMTAFTGEQSRSEKFVQSTNKKDLVDNLEFSEGVLDYGYTFNFPKSKYFDDNNEGYSIYHSHLRIYFFFVSQNIHLSSFINISVLDIKLVK